MSHACATCGVTGDAWGPHYADGDWIMRGEKLFCTKCDGGAAAAAGPAAAAAAAAPAALAAAAPRRGKAKAAAPAAAAPVENGDPATVFVAFRNPKAVHRKCPDWHKEEGVPTYLKPHHGPIPQHAPTAVVFRNVDGCRGRKLLAEAGIDPKKFYRKGMAKMAGGEDFFRTSSLTEGSTQTNDIFDFLHGEAAFGAAIARDVPVVAQVKERLATFLADKGGHECVIGEPDELKQFCQRRVHAFPPRRGRAPVPGIMRMCFAPGAGDDGLTSAMRDLKECDDEGGRMHGHRDEVGTGAVMLLNIGAPCEFFVDSGFPSHGCTAQNRKEQWCAGNGDAADGHWAQKQDCAPQYGSEQILLLQGRRCRACAEGGRGEECPQCVKNTVILNDGDLIVFNGRDVFHGVRKILPRETAPAPPTGPPLPSWAQEKVDQGYRISVQWRLMDTEQFRRKEQEDLQSAGATGPSAAPPPKRQNIGIGWPPPGQDIVDLEAQQIAAATAASLKENYAQPGSSSSGVGEDEREKMRRARLAALEKK